MEEWPFHPSRSFHSGKAIQPDTSVLCSNGSFHNPSCGGARLGCPRQTDYGSISFRLGTRGDNAAPSGRSGFHIGECVNPDKTLGKAIDA